MAMASASLQEAVDFDPRSQMPFSFSQHLLTSELEPDLDLEEQLIVWLSCRSLLNLQDSLHLTMTGMVKPREWK